MLFVGDDWAEDHHDVEISTVRVGGWLRSDYRRALRDSVSCMS